MGWVFDPAKPHKLKIQDPEGAGGLSASFAFIKPGPMFAGRPEAWAAFKDRLLKSLENDTVI